MKRKDLKGKKTDMVKGAIGEIMTKEQPCAGSKVFPKPIPTFDWKDLDGKTLYISVSAEGLVIGHDENNCIWVLADTAASREDA